MPYQLIPVTSGDTTIATLQDENDQLVAAYNRGQLNIDPNEDQDGLIFRQGNVIRHTLLLDQITFPAIRNRSASQYIIEELGFFFRKLTSTNGGNGQTFSLSGQVSPNELLQLALTGSQGTNSTVDIQLAQIGQTLLVSPKGEDSSAARESIRNHFSSLQAAIDAAQTGDTLLLFGEIIINQVLFINDKQLNIVCLGAQWRGQAGNPLLQLSNSKVMVSGNYSIHHPQGSLASIRSNSQLIFDGFDTISLQSGFSASDSAIGIARNGNAFSISTTGNGTVVNYCTSDSQIIYDSIRTLTCRAANFSSARENGSICVQNIEAFSFEGLTLCNNAAALGRGYFKMKNIANAQINGIGTTSLSSGAIAGTVDAQVIYSTISCNGKFIASSNARSIGKFTLKDSDITCSIATPIRIQGTLICTNTRIAAPYAAPVIAYLQDNAQYNQITNSRLENTGGHVLDFTGNPNSEKLLIQGNQLSGGIQDDAQLIAADNLMINGQEVDLGQTINPNMSIDFSMGSVFYITLTQQVTLSFQNVLKGKDYSVIFLQDGTGNHEVNLPAACEFAGSATHPSFNYPAAFVVKMQLRLERISNTFHCSFTQFAS